MFANPDPSKAKFLIMETVSPTLRSEVHGWSYEDISLINPAKPIGLSLGWNPRQPRPQFTCVAFALAAGWKLLGPPTPIETPTDNGPKTFWTWWLQLDKSSMAGDL
jgi:hypothetical protein